MKENEDSVQKNIEAIEEYKKRKIVEEKKEQERCEALAIEVKKNNKKKLKWLFRGICLVAIGILVFLLSKFVVQKMPEWTALKSRGEVLNTSVTNYKTLPFEAEEDANGQALSLWIHGQKSGKAT